MLAEADRVSREARAFQDETREDANKKATDLINQSRRRAEALSRKAQGYADNAVKDARERLNKLTDEREQVTEFLDSMDKLMSTESMVSLDQSETEG